MFVINKHAKNEEKGQGRFRDALIERNAIFQFVAARRRNLTWCWEEMETQMEVGAGGGCIILRSAYVKTSSLDQDRQKKREVCQGRIAKRNFESWRVKRSSVGLVSFYVFLLREALDLNNIGAWRRW